MTDISPLSDLSQVTKSAVKTIYFNNNKIEDISALAGFNNLSKIKLDHNNIKTISPVFNNINPTYLFLNNNDLGANDESGIDALNSLINATNLVKLDVSYNPNLKKISSIKNSKDLIYFAAVDDENIIGSEISAVKGILANCTNLEIPSQYFLALDNSTKLNLANLDLTDDKIDFLKNNTSLLSLNLADNTKITDTKLQEILPTLTNLQALNLKNTKIGSLAFTNNIHNLISLDLRDTSITDLSLLNENEKSLGTLAINNAQIDLIAIQTTISRLGTSRDANIMGHRSVGLAINNATLMSKLNDCTEITKLYMYNDTGASNATVNLSNCTKLTYLLSRNNNCNFILPSSLITLSSEDSTFDFTRCVNLSSVEMTRGAGNNERFSQVCNELKNYTTLRKLIFGYNVNFNDISPITQLINTGLTELVLISDSARILGITDLYGIEQINTLQTINCSYTNISSVPNLVNCSNLQNVSITISKIKNLEFLKNCTNLTTINLSNNSISSIHGIENLRKLTNLNISNNSLYDIYSYTDGDNGVVTKNTVDILADLNKNGVLNTLNISGNAGITGYGELPNLKWTGFAK